MEILLARQPIVDRFGSIDAFELLYRSVDAPAVFDGDLATMDVLTNTLVHLGVDRVAEGKRLFINFTGDLLQSELIDHLDPTRFVIEVLETVHIDSAMLHTLKKWKEAGFMLALDDFVTDLLRNHGPELFDLIDLIKIDIEAINPREQSAILHILKRNYPHMRFLAERVETHEDHTRSLEMGYDWFQGYFYAKPMLMKGKAVPPQLPVLLKMLKWLETDEYYDDVIDEIERNPYISVQVLQLINSPGIGLRNTVSSVRQAISLLGFSQLKSWISLIVLREMKLASPYKWSNELLRSSLHCAKLCELFATETKTLKAESAYMIGLLSHIDALLSVDIDEIIDQLPIEPALKHVLQGEDHPFRDCLLLAISADRGEFERFELLSNRFGISKRRAYELLKESQEWLAQKELHLQDKTDSIV
ncbi:EAL and HDOD domain-containing protein [Exiguobacterium undae]|uniref:Diguanylate phosphodiesterase n=1 Tax=Exiguobacterium undae TaxID=169177 RepID=A0ABX2V8Z5_9BACL|nr:HDOD domain-containing protein [Exiguobacterium undae]OAN14693.1 diguanylate phosphodiesterase [Exiguobacterium undae]